MSTIDSHAVPFTPEWWSSLLHDDGLKLALVKLQAVAEVVSSFEVELSVMVDRGCIDHDVLALYLRTSARLEDVPEHLRDTRATMDRLAFGPHSPYDDAA